MWESTQLMSCGGIIGTIAAVMTRPNRQNQHTTVKEVEGNRGYGFTRAGGKVGH